jgi:hypothetical protein
VVYLDGSNYNQFTTQLYQKVLIYITYFLFTINLVLENCHYSDLLKVKSGMVLSTYTETFPYYCPVFVVNTKNIYKDNLNILEQGILSLISLI